MSSTTSRRVVITGLGVVCPLGDSAAAVWDALRSGRSGVDRITSIPTTALPVRSGAEARWFTGEIDQFGVQDKALQRSIRKGQKLMCREIEMGVASAQQALADAGLTPEKRDTHRTGVIYGSDYIMTMPEEFCEGIRRCTGDDGKFRFDNWAEQGLPQVNPLWLLKYLPNMPASHIAIYNDLQGPNNSLTLREASSCAAMAEAYCTILRGHADAIVVGATGTRIHPFRTLHALTQEPLASERTDPTTMSRPFDADRDGAVVGEGSAALILEEFEHAQARGATIWGEVAGSGSAAVGSSYGPDFQRRAIKLVANQALRSAKPTEVGHINAHGISTLDGDMHEAQGLADVFGEPAQQPPTVAAKSYFGNLGAAGGMVELICSLLALKHGSLFRTLNHVQSDPRCPVRVNTTDGASPGDSFLKVSVTPQGQASAIYVRRV